MSAVPPSLLLAEGTEDGYKVLVATRHHLELRAKAGVPLAHLPDGTVTRVLFLAARARAPNVDSHLAIGLDDVRVAAAVVVRRPVVLGDGLGGVQALVREAAPVADGDGIVGKVQQRRRRDGGGGGGDRHQEHHPTESHSPCRGGEEVGREEERGRG
ncbi:hypothetical protein I4F81_003009 [Pyropia yezoensis]|uniref:Uncharacterized protein n=1 Tax=Pyropia yezoensis TaxID=2788 RepID=A0ACC3BRQ2_PYRYE|nr:hypothetical protein I4F81_003009 [Neopyropia yezoensis]